VRRRTTAALLAAAGLMLVGARPEGAFAAARPNATVAVKVTPAAGSQLDGDHAGYAVTVQAGGGVWQSVVVENRLGDGRVTVRLAGTGAAGRFAHPSISTLVLAPHEREPVPFTVAPPRTAPSGRATGALSATVVDTASHDRTVIGTTTSVAIRVNVVGGTTGAAANPPSDGRATSVTPDSSAAGRDDTSGLTHPAHRGKTPTSDVVMLVAVVGALVLLVLAMIGPPTIRAVAKRRDDRLRGKRGLRVAALRANERIRSLGLRRRTARVADAEVASGAIANVAPPELSRADVRRAEQQRRVAERRERLRAERQRLREEARRAAAEAWDERARAMRERVEADARARAEAIESARRFRAQRAAELVAERRAAEERRLETARATEARRREEVAERARRRAEELATRRQLSRDADAAMREDVVIEDLAQKRATELSRAAVVRLRSEEARELARTWIINVPAGRTTEAPPPLPGEHDAVEQRLVALPAPAPPDDEARDDAPAEPPRPTEGAARQREKVAVVALDVDALNARLQRGR
jgi:hypothetical protein